MRIVVETDQTIAGCDMPTAGEVWMRVENGHLYEMREWKTKSDNSFGPHHSPYRAAHRVGAPETHYGCDSTVHVAVFDQEVKEGRWIKVHNCPTIFWEPLT